MHQLTRSKYKRRLRVSLDGRCVYLRLV
ncbi:hypothetical protein Goshw_015587 [Gossypium schwendimanii]|uniref:Uncharacterized protein n=1 Tax=Gossypium schwendimanii TaxID=34291 RepID=A0A7J9MP60_GOSSC|nr:hypothetical protein [Gossypium schwendimanii]